MNIEIGKFYLNMEGNLIIILAEYPFGGGVYRGKDLNRYYQNDEVSFDKAGKCKNYPLGDLVYGPFDTYIEAQEALNNNYDELTVLGQHVSGSYIDPETGVMTPFSETSQTAIVKDA